MIGAAVGLVVFVAVPYALRSPTPVGTTDTTGASAAALVPAATSPVPSSPGSSPSPETGDTVPGQATPTPALPPPSPTPAPSPSSRPPEDLEGYVWPLPRSRITSWFGPRETGFVLIDGVAYHDGLDMATFCGDWILAAHEGTVLHAGRQYEPYLGYIVPPDAFYARLRERSISYDNFPIVVVIDDGNGYRSVYVHLGRASVQAGDHVTAGQRIGREGDTGHATGCHLHYGLIRMDGEYQTVSPTLQEAMLYPSLTRERIDPLRVLSLFDPDAAKEVRGNRPPVDYPRPTFRPPRTPSPSGASPDASVSPRRTPQP